MSITDDLRYWFKDRMFMANGWQEIHDIADRIDTEHERGMNEMADRYSELRAKMNNCYVELPKDADGEYVHIGDVMVYADGNTCPMKAVALVPPAVFLTEDGPRYADMCRHKPPTVEDVLHDFICDHEEGVRDEADLIAEYAAKLRLAGDAE